MKKKMLWLSPDKGKQPTKTLDSGLNKISAYKGGKFFTFAEIKYKSIHTVLAEHFDSDERFDWFLVLGAPTDYGRKNMANEDLQSRKKKGDMPTIEWENESDLLVLDIDGAYIKGFDPFNPEAAFKKYLAKKGINCDFTWQLSSSQKVEPSKLLLTSGKEVTGVLCHAHIFLEADKAYSLGYRKTWATSEKVDSDGSVYSSVQPIYLAPPIIKKGKDPIKKRHGFVKGKLRKLILPLYEDDAVRQRGASSYSGYSEDDFKGDLPEKVLSGEQYRRYFMPYAFSLANKGLSEEDIFALIEMKSARVRNREFDADNVREYIRDAYERIEEEETKRVETASAEEIQKEAKKTTEEDIPPFPEDVMLSWPEPWPMIWENFKRFPRDIEPALLFPAVLQCAITFLGSRYVYEGEHRRPNLTMLALAPSTAGKDVNTINVMEHINRHFAHLATKLDSNKVPTINAFQRILRHAGETVTADSTYLKAFDENYFPWVNTEATDIFRQFGSGQAAAVQALNAKIIECRDGLSIKGKTKAEGKVQTIEDPVSPILWCAQPRTIKEYMNMTLVEKGFLGRMSLFIIPTLKGEKKSVFRRVGVQKEEREIDEDFYHLFTFKSPTLLSTDKIVVHYDENGTESDFDKMETWQSGKVSELREMSETHDTIVARIGMDAEQLYTVIMGVCREWDRMKGKKKKKVRKHIDPTCMIPLLDYWLETKMYMIEHLITSDGNIVENEFMDMLKAAISKNLKSFQKEPKDRKIFEQRSMLRRSYLANKLALRKNVKAYYEKFPQRQMQQDFVSLLRNLQMNEIIVEEELDNVSYIGLMK